MNPYKQVKEIVRKRKLDPECVVHALMATVYATCDEKSADVLRSEDFLKAFDSIAAALALCRKISKEHESQSFIPPRNDFVSYQEEQNG